MAEYTIHSSRPSQREKVSRDILIRKWMQADGDGVTLDRHSRRGLLLTRWPRTTANSAVQSELKETHGGDVVENHHFRDGGSEQGAHQVDRRGDAAQPQN
jgi:hypothetical protein